MTVIRSNLSGILDPGHKAYQDNFFDVLLAQPMLFPTLFNIRGSEKGDETMFRSSDVAYIPERNNEQGVIEEREYAEDGSVTFTHAAYVAKFVATHDTWMDMSDELRGAYPALYANSARSTMENVAFGVLRDAFAGATYTGPDGLALCSNSHTLKSGDTADNLTATALSVSSINAARAAMMRLKTSQGRVQVNQMARYLVVPPEKEADAKEFTGATYYGLYPSGGEGAGSESNYNFASQQNLMPFVVPYLTDVNDWFLVIDKGASPHGLVMYDREQPSFKAGWNDENHYYWGLTSMRFSVGFDNWRQVYGSSASA